MAWMPSESSDAFWFAIAPVTSIPFGIYAAAGYVTGDYPAGKPDYQASIRNAVLWAGAAGAVHGWNLAFSPHNATFVSPSAAWKVAGHVAMANPVVAGMGMLSAPMVAGYAANRAVIRSAPEHRQASMWQVVSQSLTGTGPGIGSGDVGL